MPQTGNFWLAIAKNDVEKVIELIELDPSIVKYRNPNAHGSTPLHKAAGQGNPVIVRALLDNGADVNAQDNLSMEIPLHLASKHGYFKVVKLLLDHGADVTIADINGKTSLFASTDIYSRNPSETQALLLAAGADRVMTIFDAIRLDDIERIDEMLNANPELTTARDTGYRDFTLLHHAAETCHVTTAEYLLSRGADIHAVDCWGWTPISLAKEFCESYEMVDLLRSNGA